MGVESESTARFSKRELEVVALLAIVVVCLTYLFMVPSEGDEVMVDHELFAQTTQAMREGASYYEAMDLAFAEVYGPERSSVTETVRGYRLPTVFWLWSSLPSEHMVFVVFVVIAGIAGAVGIRLSPYPQLGVVITVFLLANGMLVRDGGWFGQYLTVELWAVPALAGAIVAAGRERWGWAATLALCATAVRELAAPLLIAGVVLALTGKAPRRPWLVAGGLALVGYSAHFLQVRPYIDPTVDTPLFGDSGVPWTFFDLVGFGLPAGTYLGTLLWVMALIWCAQHSEVALLAVAPLGLAVVGLIVDRPYWGILVVPFSLVWGLSLAVHLGSRLRPRASA